MPDRGDAYAGQILSREAWQNLGIDVVLSKERLVLLQSKAAQPRPDVQRRLPQCGSVQEFANRYPKPGFRTAWAFCPLPGRLAIPSSSRPLYAWRSEDRCNTPAWRVISASAARLPTPAAARDWHLGYRAPPDGALSRTGTPRKIPNARRPGTGFPRPRPGAVYRRRISLSGLATKPKADSRALRVWTLSQRATFGGFLTTSSRRKSRCSVSSHLLSWDPDDQPTALAAAVQRHHEARPVWSAAKAGYPDAEGPVPSRRHGGVTLDELERRLPEQRAIGK